MRQFKSQIFMGADTISEADCIVLHKRLEDGLGELSRNQQADTEDKTKELEEVVRDIAAALLGRAIQLGQKLAIETPEQVTDERKKLHQTLTEKLGERYGNAFDIEKVLVKATTKKPKWEKERKKRRKREKKEWKGTKNET